MRSFGIGLVEMTPYNSTGPQKPTTPSKHPSSQGLEAAINAAVDERFDQGGGGGSNVESRLRDLETEMTLVKERMVTKELFEERMRDLTGEVSKIPFKTFAWLLATVFTIALLFFAATKLIQIQNTDIAAANGSVDQRQAPPQPATGWQQPVIAPPATLPAP